MSASKYPDDPWFSSLSTCLWLLRRIQAPTKYHFFWPSKNRNYIMISLGILFAFHEELVFLLQI